MDNLSTLLKSLFPVSVEILSASDISGFSVWAGDLDASQTANLFNVEHFETVVKSKSPDALYEATLHVNGLKVSPIENGYRLRFQCFDLESLDEFLGAIVNA